MQKLHINNQKSKIKIRWFTILIVVFFCACKTTSQVKKVENVGFSAAKVALKKVDKFADSKYLRDMSALDFPTNQPPHKRKDVMVVTPDLAYDSWRGLLFQNQNIRYFLITPGDYRKWGALRPQFSGNAKRPYIFRYYDPKAVDPYNALHPVKRKAQRKEAVLERFQFQDISHWVMHGLTFRGQATEKEGKRGGLYNCFFQESNHNTLDFCLIEQVILGNGVRVFNSHNNTIQRCVIRDKVEGTTGDNIGVTVYASQKRTARNNRIVDNEVYNMTDGVQLVYQVNMGKNAPLTGEVPGTIIDNNDLYITRKIYRQKNGEEFACAEDGIDIKVGTNSPREEDKIRVTNNRIWGFRTTDTSCGGSSHGSGIMIHRNSKNILIENNVIFDISRGISVAGKSHKFKDESVSNVIIRNNILYNIQDTGYNTGFAFVMGADVLFESNTIKSTKNYLAVETKTKGTFRKNLVLDSRQNLLKVEQLNCKIEENHWVGKKITPKTARLGKQNRVSDTARKTELKNYNFYTKRWTKPAQRVIPGVLLK